MGYNYFCVHDDGSIIQYNSCWSNEKMDELNRLWCMIRPDCCITRSSYSADADRKICNTPYEMRKIFMIDGFARMFPMRFIVCTPIN